MIDTNRVWELINIALDAAKRGGAAYADVRIMVPQNEHISVKNGIVESTGSNETSGIGVRVLKDGAWGFSSVAGLENSKRSLVARIRNAVNEALELAKVSAWGRTFPIELAPLADNGGGLQIFKTPYEIDPFAVSVKEKMDLLLRADEAMNRGSSKLIVRESSLSSVWIHRFFASQEGDVQRTIEQQTLYTMFGMAAIASDGSDVQQRSFGFGRNPKAGYEALSQINIDEAGRNLAEEAEALLSAPECPSGVMDVIILPDHLGLHVHETGHGFEGDRLLGYEQTYVGGTFISDIVSQIGTYQFGSPEINIVADATLQNGFGTFGFDDEGTPAQKVYLVRNGILESLLTSRETVPHLNRLLGKSYFRESNGAMRASSFNRMPLIRMTNISLLPGADSESLETLTRRIDHGIVLTGTYSWSMSEDRRDFDFSLEKGIMVENGRMGHTVKNPGYTGDNLKFWKSCDGVAGPEEWEILNVPNCGKGLPGQTMFTGHGTSPALFRDVTVYNRKGVN